MAENTFTPYAHMTIPQKFVSRPFETKPNEQGKIYTKAIVTMPKGVSVNGIDLSGYKASLFMSDRAMQQKVAGEPCTFSMNPDKEIQFWKDKSDGSRSELYVRPWDIAKAVKAQRESYAAEKAQERAAAKEADKDIEHAVDDIQQDIDGAELDIDDVELEHDSENHEHDDAEFDVNAWATSGQESVEQIIAAAQMSAECHAEERANAYGAQGDLQL